MWPFVAVEPRRMPIHVVAEQQLLVGQPTVIRDAVHVYDVAQVTDRGEPSVVSVGWSVDNLKVVLLINSSPHAIFDFQRKQGFCRSGFPLPLSNTEWSARGHGWDESASALFR